MRAENTYDFSAPSINSGNLFSASSVNPTEVNSTFPSGPISTIAGLPGTLTDASWLPAPRSGQLSLGLMAGSTADWGPRS